MTDILEFTDKEVGVDLSYSLPQADYSSNGVIHHTDSLLSEHVSGQKVTFNVPNLGYLNAGSWITVRLKSSGNATILDNVYACFSQLRVLCNGVEISNIENFNVVGSMFLKDMASSSLGRLTGMYGMTRQLSTNIYDTFVITFPKNYVLNPDHKIPLKNFSSNMVIELTVAPTGSAFYAGAGRTLTVGRCTFNMNLSDLDSELDTEIMNRMIDGDSNPDAMIPFVFDDWKTLSTSSPATAGTQVLVYNDLVSSMKSLRLILQDSAKRVALGQRHSSSTFFRNHVTQYQIKANGQNLIQNPVTVMDGDLFHPDAYQHYLDVARHYNPDIDRTGSMFNYNVFYDDTNAYADAQTPPTVGSFQACVDADSQNRDLLRGLKVLNSLAVEITKADVGDAATAILVENYNRIVFLGRSKLRLIR